MKWNLFNLAKWVIFADLTLLFSPDGFLLSWRLSLWLSMGCLLIFFVCRKRIVVSVAFFMIACGYVHYPAFNLLQQAEQVKAETLPLQLRIVEVLHQQDYQTLIAETQLNKALPIQRIFINWKAKAQPQLDDLWQADVAVRPLSARLNFGGFDRQQWYFAKGVTATGTVKSAVKMETGSTWRAKKLQQVRAQTEGLSLQGLLIALAFGERAWLDKNTWSIYQQTNTAHLIAISGLHIGLAMGIGFVLGRLLQLMLPTRWIHPLWPRLGGLCFALIYAYLAGFSVPTFRAMTALVFVSLIQLARRYYSPFQLFVLVVACLLLWDPLMPLSTSFWLSVGAVACLILWYQTVPFSLFQWRHQSFSPKVRWILGLFHLQFGLLLLFTPLQLFLFNGIGGNGFWANLIAVPLYSFFLVPLILFATFTQGALFSWPIANWLAEKITDLIALFQGHWLHVSINWVLISTALCSLIFYFILWMIYRERAISAENWQLKQARGITLNITKPLPAKQQRGLSFSLLGVAICCLLMLIFQQWNKPQWQLDTLDVGQGLATLIVKNNKGILYDTGPAWQGGSMAELEILPYLQREGIELERIILSHDDNDHSGGAKALLKAYPNAELMSSSTKNYGEHRRVACFLGNHWQWQGLSFRVLSPENMVARADNADSCVLLIEDGRHSVLLTGDAETKNEQIFARTLGQIDVLQVGHHGSKTSTGEFLLAQTKPAVAIISSGRWNPWKFPHSSVVERLKQHQSAVENTAVSGQIRVNFYENHWDIQRARTDFSPWYARVIGLSSE